VKTTSTQWLLEFDELVGNALLVPLDPLGPYWPFGGVKRLVGYPQGAEIASVIGVVSVRRPVGDDIPASIEAGDERFACCQPEAVSFVNSTVASNVPVAVQR
jgi:hypothetical protein